MRKITIALMITLFAALSAGAKTQKTVVAYFSATGTTKAVAEKLAKEHKADLFRIEPKDAYTDADLDWRDKQSRSSLEMKDKKSRPELEKSKSLAAYDVIYIGYPIWWNLAPRVINTFIEQASLDGKTVIPFATSGGSTIENSVKVLKASYPAINWQDGMPLND